MTVTLPPEFERFVTDQLADGIFSTPDAVVVAGLNMLRSQSDLKAEVFAGIEQVKAGKVAPFNPSETLARIRAQRQTEG